MLQIKNPSNFRRTLVGLCLIVAPLIICPAAPLGGA